MPPPLQPLPILRVRGFTSADFDGTFADGRGQRFNDGMAKRTAANIGPGAKGGRGGTMAQSSARTSALMVAGGAQRTSQFLARGTSARFTGTAGYQGFSAGRTLAQSVRGTLNNARQASAQLSRQNQLRQTSNLATGAKNYRVKATPASLHQSVNRTTANARKASAQLSQQHRQRQTSNVATGGRRYHVKATPASLHQAVNRTTAANRRASDQRTGQFTGHQRSNTYTGTGRYRMGHKPTPAGTHRALRRTGKRLQQLNDFLQLHPAQVAQWRQAQQWMEQRISALNALIN